MDDSTRRGPIGSPSRRSFLQSAGAAAATAVLPGRAAKAQRPERPNILFIMADDLGYADLSSYGRRDYRTPVLDRLAADGVKLTQGYANSAVCSPTRVALITGRYHQRLPVGLPEPIPSDQGLGLPADFPTLPRLLKQAGYRNSLVGKWHMGWPPDHGPLRAGYDRYFGTAGGAVDYFSHRQPATMETDRPGLYEGEAIAERDGYLTELLRDRAIDEIRAADGEPFLLSLHFTAPHWPWEGPSDSARPATPLSLRHNDGGSLETFAAMVRAMDAAIGAVLAELDRRGLARNTIVVFTSDNGGERFSDTWPLRGGKSELLEGGIRVPVIVRWPGRVRPGSTSQQVMASMDWLPTLAAAAGAPVDPHYPPDGENLLAVLQGREPARTRRIYWRFRAREQAAVRDGDWKYLRMDGQEFLYDVARDPRERANLREREAATFDRLRAAHAEWNAAMLPYPAPPAA
jgi:arylsulfatase A-like enzyme